MNKKTTIILVIAAVIVGVVIFIGGMKYGQSKVAFPGNGQNSFQQGNIGANFGGAKGTMKGSENLVSGEIISKDDKSITVKLNNSGSKIVFLSQSTQVQKTASGTIDDLVTGEQVVVTGITNSDGSITAQSVQVMSALSGKPANQ